MIVLFAIPSIILLLFLGLIGLIKHKWRFSCLLFFAVIIINVVTYSFPVRSNSPHLPEKKDVLRVLSFNMNLTPVSRYSHGKLMEFIHIIERINPDVLCLQECSIDSTPEVKGVLDSLFCYTACISNSRRLIGSYIYTKKNITNPRRVNSEIEIDENSIDSLLKKNVIVAKSIMPCAACDVEMDSTTKVGVYSCYLQSNAYSMVRRKMKNDDRWFKGIPNYIRSARQGTYVREWEAENVRLDIDDLLAKDMPVIVAGDFNDLSASRTLRILQGKDLKDAWWEGGLGFGFTYFGWNLRLRLDHILYNDKFELVNVFIPKTDLSDHRPIVADFRLRN